jgi:hypothetical protein
MTKTKQLALIQESPEQQALKSWALVELFGHQRIVGLVTVEPVEFPGMVRVDVPDLFKDGKIVRKGLTRYVGKASLYGVTPITQEAAMQLLPSVDGAPAQPYSFARPYHEEE